MYIEKFEKAPCVWIYKDYFDVKDFLTDFEEEAEKAWGYVSWSQSKTGSGNGNSISEYRSSVEADFSCLLYDNVVDDVKDLSKKALEIFKDIDKCIWDYRESFNLSLEAHENINLLKYENNAQYHSHHDHASINGRILSLVACFSDGFEGGELEFPFFDLKIKLEKNSLVLFPSNFPYTHIAHPVTSGTKYSLVTWFV
jgi:hypothetical protein